jgi:alpha-glucosidase
MLLDDLQFGSHEVLSARAVRFLFVVFGFLFLAATSASEHDGRSPAEFWALSGWTGSPLPGQPPMESRSAPAHAVMQITALRDDVLRVRVGPPVSFLKMHPGPCSPSSRTASVAVTPESSAQVLSASRPPKLVVSVQKDPLSLTVTDLEGHVISEDLPGRPIEFNGASFRVFRKSPIDEHYFGLGDKPGPLDRRNEVLRRLEHRRLRLAGVHGPHLQVDPLLHDLPQWRIAAATFLDNTWRASFDFNKEYRDGYSFGSEGGPLDYYILYGPDPKAVMRDWAWLVGTTPSATFVVARLPAVALQLLSRGGSPSHRFQTAQRTHSGRCDLARYRLPA